MKHMWHVKTIKPLRKAAERHAQNPNWLGRRAKTLSVYFHELIFPQMRWKNGKKGVCRGENVRQNNNPLPSLFEIINLQQWMLCWWGVGVGGWICIKLAFFSAPLPSHLRCCNWLTWRRGIAAAPNMWLIMWICAEAVLFPCCCLPPLRLPLLAHLGLAVWHVVVINTCCSLWWVWTQRLRRRSCGSPN